MTMRISKRFTNFASRVVIFLLLGILSGCQPAIVPSSSVTSSSPPTLTPTAALLATAAATTNDNDGATSLTLSPTAQPMPHQSIAPQVTITYLARFDLRDANNDLREPSGLALGPESNRLWTVSDDNRRLFAITTTGEYRERDSFLLDRKDLEGIAVGPMGHFLYAVQEENNLILQIELLGQAAFKQHRLRDMAGYVTVADFFAGSDTNKGLEGIDWHPTRNSFFVVKERDPGLLLELSADLTTILNVRHLTPQQGFVDDDVPTEELDFSGLFYDLRHDWFWIVSDQGRRLFLYDWEHDHVVQSLPLHYERDGKSREIEKAEGIAYDASTDRLYIVSDKEARLYVFAVEMRAP